MKKHSTGHQSAAAETESLIADAQALLSATAHVAEEKVEAARQRLTDAIEKGKETWGNVRDKAVAGAEATDQVIRENPYRSLAVALGVGALVGYLLGRRNSK